MTGHVNHDRAGQDQNVIFPLMKESAIDWGFNLLGYAKIHG